MTDTNFVLRRFGGCLLAGGGALFFLAGALHPQGKSDQSFHQAMSSLLADHAWPVAHWFALIGALVIAVAVWVLVDAGAVDGAPLARVGSRVTIVASLFMAVEFALELAARSSATAYAAGRPTPLIDLLEKMQVVGWPAWAAGFTLLAFGLPKLAPRLLIALASAGALAMAIGGVVVEGYHVASAGSLFIGGNVVAIWIVWAAVRVVMTSARSQTAVAESPAPATA